MSIVTYLPYPSFTRSVMVLNDQHLYEVREGSLHIISALWSAQQTSARIADVHVARWYGCAGALIQYARATDEEWRLRRDCDVPLVRNWLDNYSNRFPGQWNFPLWLGNVVFHKTERDLLRAADSVFYANLSERTIAK